MLGLSPGLGDAQQNPGVTAPRFLCFFFFFLIYCSGRDPVQGLEHTPGKLSTKELHSFIYLKQGFTV